MGARSNISIFIEDTQAQAAHKKHLQTLTKLRREYSYLEKDSEAAILQIEKIRNAEKDYTSFIKKLDLTSMSMNELRMTQTQLTRDMNKMKHGTAEWHDFNDMLGKVNTRMVQVTAETNSLANAQKKLSKEGQGFWKMAGGMAAGTIIGGGAMAAISGFTSMLSGGVKAAAELSDQLADIQKTTGMSAVEAERLNQGLKGLNSRTAMKDLREIAISAGQLGIAKEDILAFTAATDKLNIALGDEFGSAEEVTKTTGQLRNVFSDIKSDKVDEDMMRIGNALNMLGAEGMATAPVVSDFANRIGGIGIPLGLTSGQVLGLSATLQELNVNAERGGTAVSKILQKMTTNTADFAKIAGMPLQEFTNMVNTDLMGAFTKVMEGSRKGGQSATALANVLKDAELQGAGASEVFLKLGSNTEMLATKVDHATTALKGSDSIMAEFNLKNENMAAKLEKAGKVIEGWWNNNIFTKVFQSATIALADLVGTEELHSEQLKEEQIQFMMLKSKVLDTNVPMEQRKKTFEQLQKQYPDYLKNIDIEKDGYDKLHAALNDVNRSMVEKIILQQQDEKIGEAAKVSADKKRQQMEAELANQKKLTEEAKRKNIELVGGDAVAMAEDLQRKIENMKDQSAKRTLNAIANGVKVQMNSFKKIADEADKVMDGFATNKKEMMKLMGVSDDPNKPAAASSTTKTAGNTPIVPSDEEAKKALDKYNDLKKQIEQLDFERQVSMFDKHTQEVIAVDEKYKKLLVLAKGHKEEEKKLQQLHTDELNILKKKQDEESEAELWKAIERVEKEQKAEEEANAKAWADALKWVDEETALISKAEDHKRAEAKKTADEKKALDKQVRDAAVAAGQQVSDAVFTIRKQTRDRDNEEAMLALNKQKDAELSNKRLTDKQREAIEKKFKEKEAALKTAAWEKEHKAAITQSIINGALAITKTFAQYGFTPAGWIAAAGQAVATGAQVAVIASQKPPVFAQGGFTGVGYGRADHTGFRPAGVVHEDEYVVPKHIMQNPAAMNMVGMLEAMRTNRTSGFAGGGFTSSSTAPASSPSAPGAVSVTMPGQQELVAAVNALNALLASGIKAQALIGDQAIRDLTDRQGDFASAKDGSV